MDSGHNLCCRNFGRRCHQRFFEINEQFEGIQREFEVANNDYDIKIYG
jgi:hypothetical protein